jgi:maltose alpha-D-glucosyltransferase/alpha-amylase
MAQQRGAVRAHLVADPLEIELKAKAAGKDAGLLVNLLSEAHSKADGKGVHCMLLEPYGYRWFRVGGLDYLLKRSAV